MIKGFADRNTEALFQRKPRKRFRPLARVALRKLLILHAASSLDDLKVPPGNCVEKLKGDRRRQSRIRINDQWRVCFRWKGGDAYDVEIVDYH